MYDIKKATISLNFPDDHWNLFINGENDGFYQSTSLRTLKGKFSEASDLPMIIRLGKLRTAPRTKKISTLCRTLLL